MKRFITSEFDNYYIKDNNSGEEKLIGREKDFIEYVNFYRSIDGLKDLINLWECLEFFEKNMGGSEVGVGLEIIIRYEI